MQAYLAINGTRLHLQPLVIEAGYTGATLKVELPNKMGSEVVSIDLSVADLQGILDLVALKKRDMRAGIERAKRPGLSAFRPA